MIRKIIRPSRVYDVQRLMNAYGYQGFIISGLVEEGDGYLEDFPAREIWTIERAGGGDVGRILIPISENSTPKNVCMMIIAKIEKWRRSLYGR